MIRKILQVIVSISFVIYFSACGSTPPKPYNITLGPSSSLITNQEKQTLLTHNLKAIHDNFKYKIDSSFKHNKYSNLENNSLVCHVWYYDTAFPMDKFYIYEFKYDENKNRLFMLDNSYGKGRGSKEKYTAYHSGLDGLNEYLDTFQMKLTNSYESSLAKYEVYKKEYKQKKSEFDKKYKQIHITTEDTTKIVSSKIIKKLSKYQLWPNEETAINSYIKGNDISLKIGSRVLKDKEGRYKVDYEKYKYMEEYNKFPTNLVYKINKVYYNYLPKSFIAKDKNINVEIVNNVEFADGNSMNSLKITNNTKEFIEINTIAAYYDQDVFDNILNIKSIRLAPMSYKIIKKGVIKDFPSKKLINVTDKNQKINYGFSIGYKMINQNIMKNLYKVDTYTIGD
ncbi:MAG: hypothetical protein DRG78_05895 [Epsilonproteobacteria bacterium]|nr:MAG: hypothetical protein DRG78_05895 [Campylobacterota bacterium]